ncbi:MAG: sulfatase-like hydrolase/transferase [Candidatus Aegiribacteria sp.]|nr:sulfatase-like hydrolase/transferase [Candidatus Aegiribacteria sp.]MBD3294796.1 sulfatase-like hydrolase/transferase [Candidatus Fermentibacteria bacterium]
MVLSFKSTVLLLAAMLFLSCGGSDPDQQDLTGTPDHSGPASRKSFLLIIIDTLRADHLSCYGYSRYTSPSIDSLAANGTVWTRAQAQSPWTLPSHATIWTGLSVRSHRTVTNCNWSSDSTADKNMALDETLPTLPLLMQDAGYSTFGLANVCLLSDNYGFHRGFDHYYCRNAGHGMAAASVDSLMEWLAEHKEEDFFCMLHLYDVHAPYDPPGQYARLYDSESSSDATGWNVQNDTIMNLQDRERLVAMYDGEISWIDYNLYRLFKWLRENDLDGRTVVILTSDHGEEFLDHGWIDHGHSLYQEVVHIPLIMSGPGIEQGKIDSSAVGQFDILPTVLALADIDDSTNCDGADILSGGLQPDRWVPSSAVAPLPWRENNHMASVLSGELKTVAVNDLDSLVTFNIVIDKSEAQPLPPDSQGVHDLLYYWASPQIGFPEPATPDRQQTETLRDLGYID